MDKKIAELEALLFQYGEPIEFKKIAKLLKLNEEEAKDLVDVFGEKLRQSGERGLALLRQEDKVQLVTKPDFQHLNEEFIKEEFREELTPASLEALAIIAYLGPIPRSTIDFIRGVNSSFILRSLLVRGLILREPNRQKRNVYDYRISFDFLKHIGLTKQSELPEYEKYKSLLQRFEI